MLRHSTSMLEACPRTMVVTLVAAAASAASNGLSISLALVKGRDAHSSARDCYSIKAEAAVLQVAVIKLHVVSCRLLERATVARAVEHVTPFHVLERGAQALRCC